MFEQIFSFLSSIWHELVPITVVRPWEKGVRLRFCKTHQVLGPGWHYKIPYVDQCVIHGVAMTAVNLATQTVTTLDGKEIVVEAVVRYEVEDIETALLKVLAANDAVKDLTEGAIARVISGKTREECRNIEKIENECSIRARREVKEWGIKLDRVLFTTFAGCRSLRLISAGLHTM